MDHFLPVVDIDPWGHAAVPYLNPYELNEITIDPKGLPYDIELENTSEKVAPYEGAVSKIIFQTRQGTPLLMQVQQSIPFGAEVYDEQGNATGSVGQGGQLYARVEGSHGTLLVRWGNGSTQKCTVNYTIPRMDSGNSLNELVRLNGECR